MKTRQKLALQLESTGDDSFDAILGGGIPSQSVVVIAGEPGSGKTVLTLQILFRAARQGKKCLYFTTLAEPAIKVIRYMQLFDFFDAALVDKQFMIADLTAAVRKGADGTLTELSAMIEKHQPAFVAIDSFRAIADHIDPGNVARSFVYDLATQMAGWGVTTLLVGEYVPDEFSKYAEFAIADGILRLGSEKQELTSVRELEVLKLRGMDYEAGIHFLEISEKGAFVFPRVRAPKQAEVPRVQKIERVSTGLDGLDELFCGGIPRHGCTLIQGATGTGKTILSLQFLLAGARQGEKGVLFTLEETPNQLRTIAASLGWDLSEMERKGLLLISYISPVELSTDRYLQTARERVLTIKARRAVFDSLTSMQLGVSSERRFKELVYSLSKHMRAADVTLFLTLESAQLLGTEELSGYGISFIADNLIRLRYIEVDGRLACGISILKARGIKHQTQVRLLRIGYDGVTLTDAGLSGRRGVLTGRAPAKGRSKR
jgi:circadian clock protein KaiC